MTELPTVGAATRRGVRDVNMDAYAVYHGLNDVVAAAVVDGMGNNADGAEVMRLLAQVAARVGAGRGVLPGVLAAAALLEDPGAGDYTPNGVLVLARARPGRYTQVAWIGDSHAYSWDGEQLHRRSSPQSVGEWLRQNGDRQEVAELHDNWVRLSLLDAAPYTVAETDVPSGELVLLLSDGLNTVPHADLKRLVADHAGQPQALAEVLVAAVGDDGAGYRDDATVVVLAPAGPAA